METRVTVNGVEYTVLPLREEDIKPGTLLREVFTRRAHRIACLDDGDVILRNMRYPEKCEVMSYDEIFKFCNKIVLSSEHEAQE